MEGDGGSRVEVGLPGLGLTGSAVVVAEGDAVGVGVVAGDVAAVAVGDGSVGQDEEDAALLGGRAHAFGLAEAASEGAPGVAEDAGVVGGAEAAFCADGVVDGAVGVGEDGAVDLEFFDEPGGLLGGAVADDDEFGVKVVDDGKDAEQLRGLFFAEESAEVAHEGEDDGVVGPLVAELGGVAVGSKDGEGGECLTGQCIVGCGVGWGTARW